MDVKLKHFSHEHPLIFNEERDVDDEINRDDFCNICNLPILLTSFYSCSNTDCKYLLHQPCALLLTETLHHPWFPFYRFRLLQEPHNDHSYCKRCCQLCENVTYDYSDTLSKLSFHPMCAIPLQIKSKHKSHPLHPLMAVGKKISAVCDACAQEQKGNFFVCHECDFWIHVDCALLPKILKCKGHGHYLMITYFRSDKYQREWGYRCVVCSEKMSGSGAYSCGTCRQFAHLHCAIKDMEALGTEMELQLVALPCDDPDAFRSGTIQRLQGMELHDEGRNSVFDQKLHDHPLILVKEIENSGSSSNDQEPQELITRCNACIQPIYPPFYSCTESLESGRCHFHLHQSCARLPSRIESVLGRVLELRTWSSRETLCSLFYCRTCKLRCNGFHYQETSDDDIHRPSYDIACFSMPGTVKHASHKHVLQLSFEVGGRRIKSCCSNGSSLQALNERYFYRCIDCDFTIDRRCVMLPMQVEHKFDPHPLDLITTCNTNNGDDDDSLCEFCEKHINTKFWHYGCEKCDNLFHVDCIPSVGSLSKVKFGNSIAVSCHPSHLVTFIRMLEFGSQRCGYCKRTVRGFVDNMAFHCSKCDFWMHFRCAEKCTGANIFQYDY